MTSGGVLLVEDKPLEAELFLRAFRKAGFSDEVSLARDGAEALSRLLGGSAAAAAADPVPALVLLDLKLPKVEGLEVLRRLRAETRTARVPVVVLTASNREEDLRQSYSLGANGYVRKPVDYVQYTEAVRRIGEFWIRTNEPPPREPSA
ncbi:MAG: response regulator [Planctomycetales bacterium]|nr:response regulator [Planctomycetales bacterium]